MKLTIAATLATVLVIVVGFALISPLFFRQEKVDRRLMLSFTVLEPQGASEWCRNLASILDSYNLPATVFVVGKIAQQYPETITCFSSKVDIGSVTYDSLNLTTVADYTIKLQEVQEGKAAVDIAGDIDSKVFQAPNKAADQDIYSLLSRSGIIADFSYISHYNVYQNQQFVKYPAGVFAGEAYSADFFVERTKTQQPIIIEFNNTCSTSTIKSYLSILTSGDFNFVNASQLTGLNLTGKGNGT